MAELSYITAVGYWAVPGEVDGEQALIPLQGTVAIIYGIGRGEPLRLTTLETPAGVPLLPVKAKVIDGVLCDEDDNPGVPLVLNDEVLELEGDLTALVMFDLYHGDRRVSIDSYSVTIPSSGDELDLVEASPVPGLSARGDLTSAITAYFEDHPVGGVDPEELAAAVADYLEENPVGSFDGELHADLDVYDADEPTVRWHGPTKTIKIVVTDDGRLLVYNDTDARAPFQIAANAKDNAFTITSLGISVDGTITAENLSGTNTGDEPLPDRAGHSGHALVTDGADLYWNDLTPVLPDELTDLDTTVTGSQLNALKAKVDGIEASADVTDATNVDAAGAVMNSDSSTAGMGFVIDEDSFASDLSTKVPSQQSVKAYVLAQIAALIAGAPGALDTLDELAAAFGDDANFAATMATALAGKQPVDSDLTALAALSTTSFGRALLELADAAALRTAAGLVIGTHVQAYDADLGTIAGLTATTDSFLQAKGSAWSARTVAQVKTDLGIVGVNGVNAMSFSATPTFDLGAYDVFQMAAVTAAITSATFSNGINGKTYTFMFLANGAYALAFGSATRAIGITIPNTVNGKYLYLTGKWNTTDAKMHWLGYAQEA